MDRVSVPLWGVTLSGPLPVFALVGHYPTKADGTQAPPEATEAFRLEVSNPLDIMGY